jgi:hypothetical protein
MVQQLQYITNDQGERVGVLLDLQTYQQLTQADPELLTNLSLDELAALADSQLTLTTQAHLDELLARNAQGKLSPEEVSELDQLLQKVDQLTILKTRARYTLKQLLS